MPMAIQMPSNSEGSMIEGMLEWEKQLCLRHFIFTDVMDTHHHGNPLAGLLPGPEMWESLKLKHSWSPGIQHSQKRGPGASKLYSGGSFHDAWGPPRSKIRLHSLGTSACFILATINNQKQRHSHLTYINHSSGSELSSSSSLFPR